MDAKNIDKENIVLKEATIGIKGKVARNSGVN